MEDNNNEATPGNVVVALVSQGIGKSVAERLVVQYSRDRIVEKIDFLAFLQASDPGKVKSPRGWLRRAIEEDYGPPDGYKPKEQREAEAVERERRQRELEESLPDRGAMPASLGSWQGGAR